MKRNFFLNLFFVLTLGLVNFAFSTTLEETFKKQIPAADKTFLSVQNRNGSITINGWEKNEIEVVAYKRVRAGNQEDARKIMDELEININDSGDRLEIETLYPHRKKGKGGFLSWIFNGGNVNASVEYEIRIPEKLDLDIHSTNGGIQVYECEGQIELSTTNGKIRADDISGSVKLRSTNGSVKAALKKVSSDEMSIKTTNGSIQLYLPGNIDADLEARTTNGRIRCELDMSGDYYKSKRKLEGRINDGGPLIYLKTTNGSIKVLEN